jgi:hypothetical protein
MPTDRNNKPKHPKQKNPEQKNQSPIHPAWVAFAQRHAAAEVKYIVDYAKMTTAEQEEFEVFWMVFVGSGQCPQFFAFSKKIDRFTNFRHTYPPTLPESARAELTTAIAQLEDFKRQLLETEIPESQRPFKVIGEVIKRIRYNLEVYQ